MTILAACSQPTATPESKAAKPSKPGGNGDALKLTGDLTKGKVVYNANCVDCHGQEGEGGVINEGSADQTVPPLNPIDSTLYNTDAKVFAANIDLFIEHGSIPGGTPARIMMGFGDLKLLQPQDIADVMAYIISLNKK